jgi:hypothetical protein
MPSRKSNGKFASYSGDGDVINKRMTFFQQITATGGGLIPVAGISSDTVRSNPASEWTSFAARYQAFRVRGMKTTFIARHPTQDTVATVHGSLYVADTLVSNTPGSSAQILSDEGSRVYPTHKSFTYVANWARNPNSKLWNPTSAAIPAANQLAIFYGSPDTLAASVSYFDVIIEYDIELRGSQ